MFGWSDLFDWFYGSEIYYKLKILKERFIYWLRKNNIIKKMEYYAEYKFKEEDEDISYKFCHFITGNSEHEIFLQHSNIILFLNHSFIVESMSFPIKMTGKNKMRHVKLFNLFNASNQLIEIDLEEYKVAYPNFRLSTKYTYDQFVLKGIHAMKVLNKKLQIRVTGQNAKNSTLLRFSPFKFIVG